MKLEELIRQAFTTAKASYVPALGTVLEDSAVFTPQALMTYTEIIIKAVCEETIKLEGKLLND